MTYLDKLFETQEALTLVRDQAQVLLTEIEQEINEIEAQSTPEFVLISLVGENGEWVGFERGVE